jgi:RES domain-containing protein
VRLYRIFDHAYRASAMSGEGAALTGGRWNSKGVRMVYTSETLALALLEIMSNARRTIPPGKVFLAIDVPEQLRVEHLRQQDLPARWMTAPAPRRLQEIGDDWIRRARSVALTVPSAIVPLERNALLNPSHPDFERIVVGAPQRILVDKRLRSSATRSKRRDPPPDKI